MPARGPLFETNSSSTHSITIDGKADFIADKLNVEEGVVIIYPGEFGWGVEEFTDAFTKASYLWTWLANNYGHLADEEVEAKKEQLKRVIQKQTGSEKVLLSSDNNSKHYPDGYIDHQSVEDGVGGEYAVECFSSADTLRRYLFNSASVLMIDNDNHE